VPPGVIAVLAALGALAGVGVRPVVFAWSVPSGCSSRTNCPHCRAPVLRPGLAAVLALISGRCRACRTRIAVPPALAEVLLSVLFALLAYRHSDLLVVLAFCWLAAHGAAIALIDIAVHRVPNVLAFSAYLGVIALLATAAVVGHHPAVLLQAVLAGIGLVAFYSLLALASRGGMGMGDVKLAASLGTALGWSGLPTLIIGTLLGFVLGATYGLLVIAIGHLRWRQQFAFGPFMILGAIVALVM
jgi:leader peptidase (prepilin peptidase)/N-methyltransferase